MIRRLRTLRTHIGRGCHPDRAGGRTWRPLLLRWRARRTRRPQPGTRVPAAKQTFWLPQFHLHFGARAVEPAGRHLAAAAPTLVTVDRRGTRVAHHHWSVRRVAPAIALPRIQRTSPALGGARMLVLPPPSLTARHGVRPAWSPSARAVTPVMTRQTRRPLFEPRFTAARPVPHHEERLSARAEAPRRRRDPEVMPRFATRARRVQRQEPVEAPAARPHRSPDIVWRRAAAPVTTHDVGEPSRRVFTSSARETARQIPSEAGSVAAAVAGSTPPTPLQPVQLDSALVDRLTDDVIRRVERRVRIERERRGL